MNRLLHAPLYWAIRGLIGTMLSADIGSSLRTARMFARTYAKFEPKRVKRTMDTLGVAFPTMPEDERHENALLAYEHLFMLGVEIMYTPHVINKDTWGNHVQLGDLDEPARLLVAQRPCLLLSGHCGNWELLGHTLAMLGFPMHALYRPLDLKPLDTWVRATRQRNGMTLLDKFGAVSAMPKIMAQGQPVGIVADQNAGDRGLFVPFFNRLASTYKTIGLIALRYDAPIVCGQARRLTRFRDASTRDVQADGATLGLKCYDPTQSLQYRVEVNDIIMPEDWKAQPDPLFYVTARYRRALEQMVRHAPEQNLWLHRYWKSRPRHEHMNKPLPAALKAKLRALPWMTEDELGKIEEWSARDAESLAKGQKPG